MISIITNDILEELLKAMDMYETIAKHLINKLISETNQPQKAEIDKGAYYEIQNAELLNGQENLSDYWRFDVHGEHCMFKSLKTGQTLEVLLSDEDSIGNIDPYFFYNFLETTESLKHLTKYFSHAFSDTLFLFEELARQNVLTHVYGVQYRKRNISQIS